MRVASVRSVLLAVAMIAITTTAVAQEAAPIDLRAESDGSNIILNWRAAGAIVPDGFALEAGSAPGLTDLAIVNIPWSRAQGFTARFAAAGVAPGIYYLRVRAVYNRVVSEASDETVVRVESAACPMPSAPRNVSANIAGQRVTLGWEMNATGGHASGYVIEAGTHPGAPNIAIVSIAEMTQLSMIAPPGRYFVRIRAMGPCGSSEPSREIELIVP